MIHYQLSFLSSFQYTIGYNKVNTIWYFIRRSINNRIPDIFFFYLRYSDRNIFFCFQPMIIILYIKNESYILDLLWKSKQQNKTLFINGHGRIHCLCTRTTTLSNTDRKLSCHPEVGQFGMALCVQQNVPCFDIPVDLPSGM